MDSLAESVWRTLQAQYLLRRRRREDGQELDPAVMNDLKHAITSEFSDVLCCAV